MTPLVIPASNRGSCVEEIQHVGDWVSSNNLRVKHVESMEIVHRDADVRGYPSAGGPSHPKSHGNKGAGRKNQQVFYPPFSTKTTAAAFGASITRHLN